MQKSSSIENLLLLAEQQLDVAGNCLKAGNAQSLIEASEALQITAVDLARLAYNTGPGVSPAEASARMDLLASRLMSLRENLLRHSAFVDRALMVVLPSVGETTYHPKRPYGAGPRSSGTMAMVSA